MCLEGRHRRRCQCFEVGQLLSTKPEPEACWLLGALLVAGASCRELLLLLLLLTSLLIVLLELPDSLTLSILHTSFPPVFDCLL